MTELYNPDAMSTIRRRIIRWRTAAIVIAAAALAVCVALALTVTTATEGRNRVIVLVTSILSGWALFYIVNFIVRASRAELAHARMLASEPREELVGRITSLGGRFRIRRSIVVRRVEFLTDGGQTLSLSVSDGMTRRLAELVGAPVAVSVAHKYIAAVGPAPTEGGDAE